MKFSAKGSAESLASAGFIPASVKSTGMLLKPTGSLCLVIYLSGSLWNYKGLRSMGGGSGLTAASLVGDSVVQGLGWGIREQMNGS